jgi:two-component sensor histidine kinase
VAQVHDRLWRDNEVRSIDLAGFMDELCLFLGASGPKHVLLCDVAHLSIATDRAVPLGLLANELVTNAFKYAYPDGSGEVRLSIKSTGPTRMRFEVSDSGVGLPSGDINNRSKSLGMRLIENLARQLDGRVTWEDNKPGVRFVMAFPR